MKTKEQITTANETIKNLQDYVELAKTEKKLKISVNKEIINGQLQDITKIIQDLTKLI